MGLGAVAATDQARPSAHPFEMFGISLPTGFTESKLRLIDPSPGFRSARCFLERIYGRPVGELAGVCCLIG
jgi:hypothetical protein